jgi:hypothetical protein
VFAPHSVQASGPADPAVEPVPAGQGMQPVVAIPSVLNCV